MKRSFVAFLCVFLLLTGSAPVLAAPPDNPFVGSWEAIWPEQGDVPEHMVTLQIGASGQIHGGIEAGIICYNQFGELMRGSFLGWGEVFGEDPYVFVGQIDVYCHTDQGRKLGSEEFGLSLVHDAETDTLSGLAGLCLWRRGLDSSICPQV